MKNNILDIKRVESTPTEPVSLDEAKKQCVVTFTDDDAYINGLITAARKAIENYCNISIVVKTITLTADLYTEWELPYGPVTGITSVKTRNASEGSGPPTYETATSGWGQDGEEYLRFLPADPSGWDWGPPVPSSLLGWNSRYKIIYTAGMSEVPYDLCQAILLQTAWLYEHRGEEQQSTYDRNPGICEAAKRFSDPYSRMLWL